MGKSILWYQSEDSSVGDIIFCNGVRANNINDETINFEIIKSTADKVIKKDMPWCGKVKGYFFLKGFLKSIDDHGRKMCFMYVTDNKNYELACQGELKAAGIVMDEITEQCIKKKDHPSWAILIIIALIVMAVLSVIVYQNKNVSCSSEDTKQVSVSE